VGCGLLVVGCCSSPGQSFCSENSRCAKVVIASRSLPNQPEGCDRLSPAMTLPLVARCLAPVGLGTVYVHVLVLQPTHQRRLPTVLYFTYTGTCTLPYIPPTSVDQLCGFSLLPPPQRNAELDKIQIRRAPRRGGRAAAPRLNSRGLVALVPHFGRPSYELRR
jgi:hypothetical protein